VTRLVLLGTSPRVAPGLLSAEAWQALHAGPVFAADLDLPVAAVLNTAGVTVVTPRGAQAPTRSATELVDELIEAATSTGTVTWLIGSDGDREFIDAALARATVPPLTTEAVEVDIVQGSWDLPGARLLDVVTTVDRLRSPGGCPWDAKQDHESLSPYLLEEAYEAFQAIEDANSAGLCEELGDVLFQVAFHARVAAELPAADRWTIDDVATGLVEKLVRRHPHVFADVAVSGEAEVKDNWETIKAAERGNASVVSNVALAAPALTLAASLQRKAARVGLPVAPAAAPDRGDALDLAVAQFRQAPSSAAAGELLWAAVELMRHLDIDAEAALRARARAFRDEVTTAESSR
jgi:XTP/dITP diphosphohydrolase